MVASRFFIIVSVGYCQENSVFLRPGHIIEKICRKLECECELHQNDDGIKCLELKFGQGGYAISYFTEQ